MKYKFNLNRVGLTIYKHGYSEVCHMPTWDMWNCLYYPKWLRQLLKKKKEDD